MSFFTTYHRNFVVLDQTLTKTRKKTKKKQLFLMKNKSQHHILFQELHSFLNPRKESDRWKDGWGMHESYHSIILTLRSSHCFMLNLSLLLFYMQQGCQVFYYKKQLIQGKLKTYFLVS